MIQLLFMDGVLLSIKPPQGERLISTDKSSGVPGTHFLI